MSGWGLWWRPLPGALPPEAVFAELFGRSAHAFWLDSSLLDGRARFSFLGAPDGEAGEVLTARVGEGVDVCGREGTAHVAGSVFDLLADRLARRRLPARVRKSLPFPAEAACGYVGYFGYELRAELGSPARHRAPTPDAVWMAASRLVVVDHWSERAWLVAFGGQEETTRWMAEASRRLAGGSPPPPPPAATGTVAPEPWLKTTRAAYERDVVRCLEQLRAGESYEICLTTTLEAPVSEDPVVAYRRLRRSSPAPYAAYLRLADTHVLSASPERFLTVTSDRRVVSSPIKGTAPRSSDPAVDAEAAAALVRDPKTRAENLMIVDLIRNDLGRVCRPGTVTVPAFCAVESYATVHQLVSTIEGRLRDGVDVLDAVRACFPAGSMTGAPKIATMAILDALEPRARGVYAGALGHLGLADTADLSVVIRTAVIAGGRARIGAGGAVVLDSDPAQEWAEMLLKAAVPLRAFDDPAVEPGKDGAGYRGAVMS